MDPNAAWLVMHDDSADKIDRTDAAQALLDWINRGGFLPAGIDEETLVRHALAVLAAFPPAPSWATAYRFTAEDETRIGEQIAGTLTRWQSQVDRPLELDGDARLTLTRLAAQSIGCSLFDLRDVELAWIEARVSVLAEQVTR